MAIDYDTLLNFRIPEVEQQLTKRDTMLYALGVGLGADPCDENQLKFVYDQNLVDKGKDRGALVMTRSTVREKASQEVVCTLTSTTFCRADGGFGGPAGPVRDPHPIPERSPDLTCDLPTFPQAALIYRLSGDYNPLHADPAYAKKAGFRMPILHGRCTFSIAGHALLKTCCDYDPARMKSMEGRFSSPVYPGEVIRTEMWVEGSIVSFRSSVPARNATVLNNGRAEIA